MGLLTANYPPRGASPADTHALLAAWWSVLSGKAWVTEVLFERAVQATLSLIRDYLPPAGEFLGVCEVVRDELARDAERAAQDLQRPALPAPAAQMASIDGLARFRALVASHAARGARLMARRAAIVQHGHALGLIAGTDELRAYVQREYAAVLLADLPPAAGTGVPGGPGPLPVARCRAREAGLGAIPPAPATT